MKSLDPLRPAATFGARLRAARKAAGYTLENVSERSGLHVTYVGQVERGKRNVSLFNIVRLAAAVGVNPAALMDGLKP